MEWAIDQLGNLVAAGDVGGLSFSLSCPCCHEPVFRKRGPYRRAHFSHYAEGGTFECEEYHPGQSGRPAERAPVRPPARPSAQAYVRPSIRVSARPGGGVRLGLALPIVRSADTAVDGELAVSSRTGVRAFSAMNLQCANFAPLPPAIPLFTCIGSGQMGELAAQLTGLANEFTDFNVFKDIDAGGRLLQVSEPVVCGEIYCVLASSPLSDGFARVAQVVDAGMVGRWYYVRVDIPRTLEPQEELAVSRLFRRDVRRMSSLLELVWPVPHHIDGDGSYIFPFGIETLLVAAPESSLGEVVELKTGVQRTQSHRVTQSRLQFDLGGADEGVVLLDQVEQFRFKLAECSNFSPRGIRAASSGQALISGIALSSAGGKLNDLVLECPTERVAAFVARRNKSWHCDGSTLRLGGSLAELDAGSFGRITVAVPALDDPLKPRVSRGKKAVWVESVLTSALSRELLSMLPWGESPDHRTLSRKLMERRLEWLRAHIAHAAGETL